MLLSFGCCDKDISGSDTVCASHWKYACVSSTHHTKKEVENNVFSLILCNLKKDLRP